MSEKITPVDSIADDFHVRYEFWALFESWQDLPGEIKDQLNQWELASFADRKKPHIDAFKKSGQRDKHLIWPEYVLLDEALVLIQKVPHVYLWPCNCRAMMRRCKKPDFVCLRFSNNRKLGWEISKERAREILLEAHYTNGPMNIEYPTSNVQSDTGRNGCR